MNTADIAEQIDPIRLYSIRQVTELLGVSEYMVNQYIESGQLRVRQTKYRGRIQITGASLVKFLEDR